ncbi:alpha/beta fold hydrolase [Halanaeroarchaeum sp. HSR-CO]|uniref:alpha/beta fold hydrolase n=1 Tax=Halanaeroarchaeum sp. HSR-CO TaxID=2866382 RepID=UPI00217D8639|nr:alpha/beta fold hydrolase [Halanaeroarchaeum sp. HSR-CO]
MRTRSIAGILAGGIVAAAAANRLRSSRVQPTHPPVDGDRETFRWRGFDVSFVTAGDPNRQDVVLLHGLHPTASNREFRGIFGSLAGRHHVIAVDLLGFGGSDRPAIRYSGSLYAALIRDFLTEVADDAIVVASSLTGSLVATVAAQADVASLVLVNPIDETGSAPSTVVRELVRAPILGDAAFALLVSKPAIRYFDREVAYYDPDAVTEDIVEAQYWSAHRRNARFAPTAALAGFLDPSEPLETSLAAFDGPVTLVWGRESVTPRLAAGRDLADAVDARLVVLDRSRLLPHDEHPDEFLEAIAPSLPGLEDD